MVHCVPLCFISAKVTQWNRHECTNCMHTLKDDFPRKGLESIVGKNNVKANQVSGPLLGEDLEE